jgi:hypothetical protein
MAAWLACFVAEDHHALNCRVDSNAPGREDAGNDIREEIS